VKVSHAKTVRFQSVVEMCGQPEIVQLWSAPRANRPFMAAVRQNRLATLFQETVGAKKDWAIAGFHERPRASYLIFPKPLNAFADRRIVGVKYELIKTPGPLGRVLPPAPEHRAGQPRSQTRASSGGFHAKAPVMRSANRRFAVRLRFTAVTERTVEVTAANRKAAVEQAFRQIGLPDFARATISRKVLRVESLKG
jgi:hypothetical protein